VTERTEEELQLTLEHAYLSEAEAAGLLEGRRLRRGGRVMDPKAQIIGELIRQLRPPTFCPRPRRRASSSSAWSSCSTSRRLPRSAPPI
jgi:hypothetical protein